MPEPEPEPESESADVHLDMVLRRVHADHRSFLSSSPRTVAVIFSEFDSALKQANNMINYGLEENRPEFCYGGLYTMFGAILDELDKSGMPVSGMVSVGREFLGYLGTSSTSPVLICAETVPFLEEVLRALGKDVSGSMIDGDKTTDGTFIVDGVVGLHGDTLCISPQGSVSIETSESS